jgi:hypothetical protein
MNLLRIVRVLPFAFAITLLSGIFGGTAIAAVIITIIRTFS